MFKNRDGAVGKLHENSKNSNRVLDKMNKLDVQYECKLKVR